MPIALKGCRPLAANRYASFYSYQRESLTWSAERNVADPRIAHQLTLAVDEYGNVLEVATVAYPRRSTAIPIDTPPLVAEVQQRMLATCNVTAYTNDVLTGGYHLRVPYEAKAYELTGLTAPAALWTCDQPAGRHCRGCGDRLYRYPDYGRAKAAAVAQPHPVPER